MRVPHCARWAAVVRCALRAAGLEAPPPPPLPPGPRLSAEEIEVTPLLQRLWWVCYEMQLPYLSFKLIPMRIHDQSTTSLITIFYLFTF